MKTCHITEEHPNPGKTLIKISLVSTLLVTVMIFSLKLIESALKLFV
jgi:hypothetical protein